MCCVNCFCILLLARVTSEHWSIPIPWYTRNIFSYQVIETICLSQFSGTCFRPVSPCLSPTLSPGVNCKLSGPTHLLSQDRWEQYDGCLPGSAFTIKPDKGKEMTGNLLHYQWDSPNSVSAWQGAEACNAVQCWMCLNPWAMMTQHKLHTLLQFREHTHTPAQMYCFTHGTHAAGLQHPFTRPGVHAGGSGVNIFLQCSLFSPLFELDYPPIECKALWDLIKCAINATQWISNVVEHYYGTQHTLIYSNEGLSCETCSRLACSLSLRLCAFL